MSTDRSTKERIFDATEAIILENGFHSLGLNEVLRSERVPKGSCYHFFESKEQFGVEMLKRYVANASAYLVSPDTTYVTGTELLIDGGMAQG